ncbi:glycine--tRNA ligase subunit beta [Adlercreutzia faecimuris]|uniref:Glycine--tRNA ligase beta subunit n=1 Tax=Adlercreutzia faecimuris TaxID=2897341 RepID=A0ABS9WIF7_9ACTN|nr:glycine--tRNA ligase subunit beta [Adlercreutzia sp. JBNU-10]MCI2242237.1 glycine--tRNA ligase subunit beta [Adlercreutzia sp. JBNU-10]
MGTKTLAFEIGTEELPAFDLHEATAKLGGIAAAALDGAGIPHGEIEVYSTPRRLIVVAADVPERTEATEECFRGPSAKIAFDADGNPTKAALGFARGKGVDASALERRDENGTEYVYAVVSTPSRDVAELLPELLADVVRAIPWPKTQRWGSRGEQFSRPVRWLLALLGDEVVPVEFAGLVAGDTTRGHRFLAPGPHKVASADELIDVLRGAYVVPSEAEREELIRAQVAKAEKESGLTAELHAKTMREVVNLVEYPTVMVGEFDELFLAVPKEITVDAMLVHQRYFPLFNADGTLANKFLITSNGDARYEANIIDGNQRVVAPRLYDAKFFYDEDLKKPLEDYVEGLSQVVFQESLGSTLAKTERVVKLAAHLAVDAGLTGQDAADAERAAYLCKADLVTGAVVEFTSVQGIMGRYYALAAGETPQVAQAIADHYRPRFAGDDLPESRVGQVVAMADKVDTICGLFAVGQAPTGSSDPFALRRAAIGVIAMLEAGLPVSLLDAIDAALAGIAADGIAFDEAAVRAEVVEFFIARVKVLLREEGAAADAIDAVLATGVAEPMALIARVRALEAARADAPETFEDLAVAFARANNLRDADAGTDCDPALFSAEEAALAAAVDAADAAVAAALAADDYPAALAQLAALRAPIDAFFEATMIMDDDLALRANHLRLLNRFTGVFANLADFGLMSKK